VPLLGDIPVLGHLFKNNTRRDEKNELMLFITPRVLPESLANIQ
jgi:type IV pilus assembly protein PilQ